MVAALLTAWSRRSDRPWATVVTIQFHFSLARILSRSQAADRIMGFTTIRWPRSAGKFVRIAGRERRNRDTALTAVPDRFKGGYKRRRRQWIAKTYRGFRPRCTRLPKTHGEVHKTGFKAIPHTLYGIAKDVNGYLFLGRLGDDSICPKCRAKLEFQRRAGLQATLSCTRNRNHVWLFDFTTVRD